MGLAAFFSGIQHDIATFKVTADIGKIALNDIFTSAMAVVGSSDLGCGDVTVEKTDQTYLFTVDADCVKYTGKVEVKYAY